MGPLTCSELQGAHTNTVDYENRPRSVVTVSSPSRLIVDPGTITNKDQPQSVLSEQNRYTTKIMVNTKNLIAKDIGSESTNTKQDNSRKQVAEVQDEELTVGKEGNPRSVVTAEHSVPSEATPEGINKINDSHRINLTPGKSPRDDNVQFSNTPLHDYNSDELPDLVLPYARTVVTSPEPEQNTYSGSGTEQTPKKNHLENISQPSTTPRSVLSDPDDTEIETANTLLSLGSLENIDKTVDNEALLPVDKPRLNDFTKELAAQERREQSANDYDSDKTEAYSDNNALSDTPQTDEPKSPKGVFRSKHYGIKRQSPTQTKIRHLRCITCDATFSSKRELNKHHRTEHANVTCPDCRKTFPTPDTLSRHRYIHQTDHQHKCKYCDRKCAFESDLKRHMEKHTEESPWVCTTDNCGRIFKRKAELTAHEVTHTGETFICEYPGCKFTNKDPRNVKRHYRVHTKEKKIKCKKCDELFVFYMQIKWHMERDHKN